MHKFSVLIGLFFYIAFYGCSEDSLSIGKELVYSSSDVVVSDTFSISTYTVKMDSIRTSGKGKALVGNYSDGALGSITAKSFFQIGQPSSLSVADFSSYDSIALITHFTNYSYGDTSKPYTLEVHKLSQKLEELENNNNYIVNTKQAAYENEILGQKTFSPPYPSKTAAPRIIRLSDNFGQELFGLIKQRDTQITDANKFYDYFKGIALVPPSENQSAILRFSADTACYIRLYYHLATQNLYLDFPVRNSDLLQFNYIKNDLTSSPLNNLKHLSDKLSSNTVALNGLSYVQAATGIMTRIEFPSIRALLSTDKKIKIINATLILSPQEEKYLPTSLNLYWTDVANNPLSVLTNSSNAAVSSTLYIDPYHIQTAYSFDVTSFVTSESATADIELPALMLSAPSAENVSLERLMLASPKRAVNPPRLKITYWRY
jgi:hypothetical protein